MAAVGSRGQKNQGGGVADKAKMIAGAILGIARQAYTKAQEAIKADEDEVKAGGYHRGDWYTSPADFYSHGSRTFMKNKRKGL